MIFNLKRWLPIAFVALCTASFLCAAEMTGSEPNVVLIIADDLGIQLGCYGDPQAKTPNIDRLAEEGVRFETAWVTAASCSPSRGSIHTGLYPHQNGLVGLAHHGFSLNKRYPTIASELKAAGYRTGIIGKHHIAPLDVCPWDFQLTQENNLDLLANNRDVRGMATIAEGFVAGNTGPFFLVMSYIDPHVPLYDQRLGLPENPRSANETKALPFSGYSSQALRERTANYLNCISRLDTGIGDFVAMLDRNGVLENTLIIFIGDHGAPFARAKMSNYDQGLRIPFIVRGPNVTRSLVSQQPVSTIDILPTLLDFTGSEPMRHLPGLSLREHLEGSAPFDPNRALFASYHAHQADAVFPMRWSFEYAVICMDTGKPEYPAMMSLVVTLVAGEAYGKTDLKEYGAYKANKIYEYTKEQGSFTEYNSPNYTIVTLNKHVQS